MAKKYTEQVGGLAGDVAGKAVDTGLGLVGNVVGSWLDEALFGNKRRQNQYDQSMKLARGGAEIDKEMMMYQQGLEKDMFDYTRKANSPAEQIKLLEEAGLNPSMIYGMQGAGGTTGEMGGVSPRGTDLGQGSDEVSQKRADAELRRVNMETAKMNAEIENIESGTKKNLAEADATSGYKQEEARLRMEDIAESIKDKRASTALKNVEYRLKSLEADFAEESYELNLKILGYEMKKAKQELAIITADRYIKEETKELAVKEYSLRVSDIGAGIILKETQGKLTEAQARAVAENVAIGWMNAHSGKEQAGKWTWEQALGGAIVESGAVEVAGEEIKKIGQAFKEMMPKEGEKIWTWIKRSW